MKMRILIVLCLATLVWLRPHAAGDQTINAAPVQSPPDTGSEIRYANQVPVLGDLPVVGRLFRSSGSISFSPEGRALVGWASPVPQSIDTILAFHQNDPKSIEELAEDLNVLSYILSRNLEQVLGAEGPEVRLGVPILLSAGGRTVQASYLEGFGCLFQLSVSFPVVAPPATEATAAAPAANLEWNQARQALYRRGPEENGDWLEIPYSGGAHFDAQLVENLKKQVLKSLRNGTNLRQVKPDEWVAVVITGTPNPPIGYSSKTVYYGGSKARQFIQVPHGQAPGLPPQSTRATVLAIRVKKSAAEALAAKTISADQFNHEGQIATYLSEGLAAAGPSPARLENGQSAISSAQQALAAAKAEAQDPQAAAQVRARKLVNAATALTRTPEAITCGVNLKLLDRAKELWGLENRKRTGDTPTMADLVPKYLKTEPTCPVGHAAYKLNPLGTNPTCPNYSTTNAERSLHQLGATE